MREDPFGSPDKARKWRNHHHTTCRETFRDMELLEQKFLFELESGRSLIPAADRLLLFLRGAGRRRHSLCGMHLIHMGLSHVPDEQIPVLLLRLIADKGTPARLRCPEDFVVGIIDAMATLGVSLHYLYYMGGTLLDSSRNRYLMSAVMANVRKVGRLLLEKGTTVEQLVRAPNGVRRCADGSGHAPVSFCLWHFQFYAEPAKDLLEWVELLLIHGAAFVLQRENNINLDKSVPHYIIEHLLMECDRTATALHLLHLYRESGGAMWLQQLCKKESANALEYLQQEKPEWHKEASILETMMQQPRSLMSFCRSAIKTTVGRNFWRDASGLGLPRELTSYLTRWDYSEEFWREYKVRLADVASSAGSSQ